MLRFLLFAGLLLMSADRAGAQDWRTVRVGDTVYFMGGPSGMGICGPVEYDSRLLRVRYVMPAAASGTDSTYAFFNSIRGELGNLPGPCVDTAAPSWQGRRVLRISTGIEYYFNSQQDTIKMIPSALFGQSWDMARDTNGIRIVATVTAAGTDTIDGNADSVKTAFLTALSGSAPVAHPFHGLSIQWSKNHGWIRTLDFYCFPNRAAPTNFWYGPLGPPLDSAVATRLGGRRLFSTIDSVDLAWKYAPGNEWITEYQTGISHGDVRKTVYTHDSVESMQWISPTQVAAVIQSKTASVELMLNAGQFYQVRSFAKQIRTDTAYASKNLKYRFAPLLPEVKRPSMNTDPTLRPLIKPTFSVKEFCPGRYFFTCTEGGRGMVSFDPVSACWKHEMITDDYPFAFSVLAGFGLIGDCQDGAYGGMLKKFKTRYLKLGDCTMGVKIDLVALGITPPSRAGFNAVVLSPNPASSTATLSNLPVGPHRIAIRNMQGQTCAALQATGASVDLPTAGLPTGVYFVEVSGREGRAVLKLQMVR